MTQPTPTRSPEITTAINTARSARDAAIRWLLDHIDHDGTPDGHDLKNGWSRLPWTLAACGEPTAASAVLGWAESSQIADDGSFVDGPARGDGFVPGYTLAHYGLGAALLGQFGPAERTVGVLRRLQRSSGGVAMTSRDDLELCDLLSTAQAGLTALVAGADDLAADAYRWIAELVAQQPRLDEGVLYTIRDGHDLVVDVRPSLTYVGIVDFAAARQAYFYPGMAAVFLTAYAPRGGGDDATRLARRLLQLNLDGADIQFADPDSVQICKFGWGVAAAYQTDLDDAWEPHLIRMVDWFAEHQAADGSWVPSGFLTPEPDVADTMIKTAEHAMEVNAILAALGRAPS